MFRFNDRISQNKMSMRIVAINVGTMHLCSVCIFDITMVVSVEIKSTFSSSEMNNVPHDSTLRNSFESTKRSGIVMRDTKIVTCKFVDSQAMRIMFEARIAKSIATKFARGPFLSTSPSYPTIGNSENVTVEIDIVKNSNNRVSDNDMSVVEMVNKTQRTAIRLPPKLEQASHPVMPCMWHAPHGPTSMTYVPHQERPCTLRLSPQTLIHLQVETRKQ